MLVSVPRAVMAMVSMNVSMYSIAPLRGISLTLSAPHRYCSYEFTQIMPKKPNANHGIVILRLPPSPPAAAYPG